MGKKPDEPKPKTWANILYLLRLVFDLEPLRVVLQFLERCVNQGTWIFFSVVFIRRLLDSIERGEGMAGVQAWIWTSLALVSLLAFGQAWFYARYRPLSDNRMVGALSRRLFSQSVRVDLACYEDQEFFDRYSLAIKEVETRLQVFLENLVSTVVGAISVAVMMAVLIRIDPWIIVFLAFPLIGNFVFGPWRNRLQYRRDKESAKGNRRVGYVNRILYLADYAKEIRLSRVMRLLMEHLEEGYSGIFAVIERFKGKAILASFLSSAFTFLFAFQGAFLYGAWLAIEKKSIDVATFSVMASATVSTSWMLIYLTDSVLNLAKGSLYIENLRAFLECEPRIRDKPGAIPAPRPVAAIEIRDLRFSYRGQEEPALRDINLSIRRGEKIAIVGRNGAGKTSLVKLLMRLYEPSSGSILCNGADISSFSLSSWRGLFGAAFQDYRVFSMTVAENVLLRDVRGEGDYERVRAALERSGVLDKVLSLPMGMDTVLTREFDEGGAILSGGELQKIAIARAFAADFEIAVLDEPSSALDPVSEYGLYRSILEVCRDRTVIFISHRLSSATLADRIVMMDGGRIVESGRHSDLMASGGAYARLFAMQAERYLEDNDESIRELDA